MYLETSRLILRPLEPRDLPALRLLLTDLRVMRYTSLSLTEADVQNWYARQRSLHHRYGLGLLAAISRKDGQFLGQVGLSPPSGVRGGRILELRYFLLPAFWTQGFATEAATACREYAFTARRTPTLCAVIHRDNLPSQRVARRIGMRRISHAPFGMLYGEGPHDLYTIENPIGTVL